MAGNATSLQAQTSPASSTQPDAIYWRHPDPGREPAEPMFARGHFELNFNGQGMSVEGSRGTETIGFFVADFGYYIVDGLSIGFEAGVAPGTYRDHSDRHHRFDNSNNSEDDNHDGGSLRMRASEGLALVRWHFLNVGRLSLYADAGLGGLHASHSFPQGRRRDDWLSTIGLGLSWRIAEHWYVDVGGRFVRLTGDDLFARYRSHEASDGATYYGGFSYLW